MSFNLDPQELQGLRKKTPNEILQFVVETLTEERQTNPSLLLATILKMDFTGKKEVTARIVNAIGGYPEKVPIPKKIQLGADALKITINHQSHLRFGFIKSLVIARNLKDKADVKKVTSRALARAH
jgi:hypothetical protein